MNAANSTTARRKTEAKIADDGDVERDLAEDFADGSGDRAREDVVGEPAQAHGDEQEAGETDANRPERVAREALRRGREQEPRPFSLGEPGPDGGGHAEHAEQPGPERAGRPGPFAALRIDAAAHEPQEVEQTAAPRAEQQHVDRPEERGDRLPERDGPRRPSLVAQAREDERDESERLPDRLFRGKPREFVPERRHGIRGRGAGRERRGRERRGSRRGRIGAGGRRRERASRAGGSSRGRRDPRSAGRRSSHRHRRRPSRR